MTYCLGAASPANARTATVARVDAIGLRATSRVELRLFFTLSQLLLLACSQRREKYHRITTREHCAQASTESRKMSAGPSAAAADSTRSSASSADEPLGDSLTSRSGWLKKKPTSHEKKAWRDAGVQKRFYVSRGLRVEYYDRAPVGEQAGKLKPRGTFDLRNVTSLRPAQPDDPTAPAAALILVVDAHRMTLDFGYKGERDAWLHIWANGVPPEAIPADWEEGVDKFDAKIRRTLLAMEPGGETARGDTYRGSYAVVRRKGSEGDSEDDDDDDAVAPDVFSPLSSKLSSKLASGKEGGRARGVSSGSPSLASLLGSTKLGDSREQIV